jgi:hypothetical protein
MLTVAFYFILMLNVIKLMVVMLNVVTVFCQMSKSDNGARQR